MTKLPYEEPSVEIIELEFNERIATSGCEFPHEGAEDRCSGY